MCEDIQEDVEDGQLQFFYILAFVLQGDEASETFHSAASPQTQIIKLRASHEITFEDHR